MVMMAFYLSHLISYVQYLPFTQFKNKFWKARLREIPTIDLHTIRTPIAQNLKLKLYNKHFKVLNLLYIFHHKK